MGLACSAASSAVPSGTIATSTAVSYSPSAAAWASYYHIRKCHVHGQTYNVFIDMMNLFQSFLIEY